MGYDKKKSKWVAPPPMKRVLDALGQDCKAYSSTNPMAKLGENLAGTGGILGAAATLASKTDYRSWFKDTAQTCQKRVTTTLKDLKKDYWLVGDNVHSDPWFWERWQHWIWDNIFCCFWHVCVNV